MKVLNTEIIDNTVEDMDGNIQPSGISVLVEVEVDNVKYCLDYQTTTTFDYGAYSSCLEAYEGTEDYEDLKSKYENEVLLFFTLLDDIAKKADVQKKWKEYVTENFDLDESHFGGLDGNSEVNSATIKGRQKE